MMGSVSGPALDVCIHQEVLGYHFLGKDIYAALYDIWWYKYPHQDLLSGSLFFQLYLYYLIVRKYAYDGDIWAALVRYFTIRIILWAVLCYFNYCTSLLIIKLRKIII